MVETNDGRVMKEHDLNTACKCLHTIFDFCLKSPGLDVGSLSYSILSLAWVINHRCNRRYFWRLKSLPAWSCPSSFCLRALVPFPSTPFLYWRSNIWFSVSRFPGTDSPIWRRGAK